MKVCDRVAGRFVVTMQISCDLRTMLHRQAGNTSFLMAIKCVCVHLDAIISTGLRLNAGFTA